MEPYQLYMLWEESLIIKISEISLGMNSATIHLLLIFFIFPGS